MILDIQILAYGVNTNYNLKLFVEYLKCFVAKFTTL